MMENRAFIRGARFAFGFTGIYSEDDAERMQTTEYVDAEVVEIKGSQTETDEWIADYDKAEIEEESETIDDA